MRDAVAGSAVRWGLSDVGEAVAVDGLDDVAGGGEGREPLVEGGVPGPALGADLGEGLRLAGLGQDRSERLNEN